MWADFALMTVLLALLLWGHHRRLAQLEWVAKPLAASLFIASGVAHGALETTPGKVLFAGLVLAALGDVFLIPKSPKAFLLGLVAFLLGHVGYALAFLLMGINAAAVGVAALPVGLAAAIVLRWLWPSLPAKMRGPVVAYVVVISTMVALAVGVTAASGRWLVLVGAVGFYLSDLSVAKGRFIGQTFLNRAWGLPLYFYSQLVISRLAQP